MKTRSQAKAVKAKTHAFEQVLPRAYYQAPDQIDELDTLMHTAEVDLEDFEERLSIQVSLEA